MRGERRCSTTKEIEALEKAIEETPNNPMLWCKRGDLIQLLDEASERYTLEEAEISYQKAIEINPINEEAYESLGHFYDCVLDDPRKAIEYFQRAIELGAGESAQLGLKQAKSQLKA